MEENRNEILETEIKEVQENTKCEGYTQSNSIAELTKGLLNFHKEMESIKYDQENPFYKSSYCSLSHLLNEVRPRLADQGIFIIQIPYGNKDEIYVNTTLMHESGEFMSFNCVGVKKGKGSQDVIGDSTYLKRASLTSILAISFESEDTDGNDNKIRNENPPTPTTERTSTRSGRRSAR